MKNMSRRATSRILLVPQALAWRTRLWSVLPPPRKIVLWVRPSTPKPFQVPEKTPCCGRVTTEFFRLEIIAVWQNSQMTN